ncbi:hypothetical protein [Geodermatophilus obscurus]|uniref:ABC-2 type transport system permease protein n=1 Tax=Geodermatophilus obscurus (strain ATCC 25078 / DSM 43160 / JCM 3152 / CCUG 61914 / KCC A-0152 / KCTC 9177 / NBRC 13315 / NRRL B-3577 / G-20) TaxID=526225 RepID=D2S3W4_GEOOG|nr:hypothetical protein [Geodermatophilus obscurus]ADB72992.1 conserved hypothetical protein [Geodermatophilus obscurus DSM 43160]
MNRVLAAARLQLVHPMAILGVPWMVGALSFAINWAVWRIVDIRSLQGEDGFTGGVLALYITVLIVFVQAVTQLMPFAMGISLSRRSYFLGTCLVGVGMALGFGTLLAVLDAVEAATGGWGVGLQFWTPPPVDVDGFLPQVAVSGAPMLALIAAGVGMGVVTKRWGPSAVWGLIIGGLVVLGGAAVLVTWMRAWTDVGRWLIDQSVMTLAVGLPLALAAALGLLAFAGIRRVVP